MDQETDETCQNEEIEALVSIYEDKLTILPSTSTKSFEIQIEANALLNVNFPENYPSTTGPNYELSAPFLDREDKEELELQLRDILSSSVGMPVIFSLSECIKDFLENRVDSCQTVKVQNDDVEKTTTKSELKSNFTSSIKCPAITTGDCIEDRKSVFQGHFAQVENMDEVQAVISKLYENRKIANATHNMYAFRFFKDGKVFLQDCDDDGETHAGSRMLHLLEILECENVLVVVSRWYGGIQLGPDRFKHINNAARNVLEIAGVVSKAAKKTKTKKK